MNKQIIITLNEDEFCGLIRKTMLEVNQNASPNPVEKSEDDEVFLNPAETVKLLRISKVTLQKWMKANKIPYLRMGRKVYFKKSEVIKTLHKRGNRV